MSILSRLANLWKGFVNLWISDIEKEHPEIAYQNAIRTRIQQYDKLKKAAAAIIRRRDEIENRYTAALRELETVNKDLEAALETEQDDLAMVLLEKKEQLEGSVADLKVESDQAVADGDKVKVSLNEVKSDIEKLKAEKDRMLAKLHSAEARNKINEQLEGLSVDADVEALTNVREHINNTVAEANLSDELKENDIDNRLKALRQQSGSVSAAKKLEALKAARKQEHKQQMQEFHQTIERSK